MTTLLDIEKFDTICQQDLVIESVPNAYEIRQQIPIYRGDLLRSTLRDSDSLSTVKGELYWCLKSGPGIIIIEDFYRDLTIVDRNTQIFSEIIAQEKSQKLDVGDHFAQAGANERIWNSFQKVAEASPLDFINYYKNPLYKLISETWLGPGYQITAQVNTVKPGGKAQAMHRDYHLGFQENAVVEQFPLSLQIASQFLTLQGAIAHVDMPVASGPTLFLPFSHQYEFGYLAWRDARFSTYFNEHAVQLPMNKGDAVFFSPAVFHGAGSNGSQNDRVANLIQISASFGKAMEAVDRKKLCILTYPFMVAGNQQIQMTALEIEAIISAVADGYPFPTNLDKDIPIGGTAPPSDQTLMYQAVAEGWDDQEFQFRLGQGALNRQA